MSKTLHIEIIVQGGSESGNEFGKRLSEVCNNHHNSYGNRIVTDCPPKVNFMTTTSDGRQTATIQFYTYDKE